MVIKARVLTFSLLALLLCTKAFSEELEVDCNLDTHLSKDQISYLKKANRIKHMGLNRNILGDDIYRIQILNNKKTNQLLVFLGEVHIKGPRASYIGKKITEQYAVRMVEGVPAPEMDVLKVRNPDFYSGVTWKRKAMQYVLLNPFDSTIAVAIKNGKTIGMNALTVATKERDTNNEYTEKDIEKVNDLIAKVNSEKVNVPMEFGDFIEPNATDAYVLYKRNERMAKNIAFISEQTASKGPQLVIVGYAHLPGLKDLLEEKNFETCKLDL